MVRISNQGSLWLIISQISPEIRSKVILVKLSVLFKKSTLCILSILVSFQRLALCSILFQNKFEKWFWKAYWVVFKNQKEI